MSQNLRRLTFCLILLANFDPDLSPAKSFAQNADTNHSVDLRSTKVRIDLPTAVKQLLAENLDLQIERIEPKAADALLLQAKGQFDPTFSAGINYLDSKKDLN